MGAVTELGPRLTAAAVTTARITAAASTAPPNAAAARGGALACAATQRDVAFAVIAMPGAMPQASLASLRVAALPSSSTMSGALRQESNKIVRAFKCVDSSCGNDKTHGLSTQIQCHCKFSCRNGDLTDSEQLHVVLQEFSKSRDLQRTTTWFQAVHITRREC